jgi:hypothetical protein
MTFQWPVTHLTRLPAIFPFLDLYPPQILKIFQ